MKPKSDGIISELNERSRNIFGEIVAAYLANGLDPQHDVRS